MSSTLNRSREYPTGRFLALAAGASVLLFLASTLAVRAHGENPTVPDVARYYDYGHAITNGGTPYRDFRLEYPPASLAVFVLPAFSVSGARWAPQTNGPARRYSNGFAALMILLGAATIVLTTLSLRVLPTTARDAVVALGLLGLVPVLLGGVVYTRYDLWPAMLSAAAIATVLLGRFKTGSAVLGVAVGAKLYPLVLLPLFFIEAWKRNGRREALACLGITAGVVAAIFAPFLALAPGRTISSVREQLGRGLQIESLGSALLAALHLTTQVHLTVRQAGNGLTTDELHGTGTTAALVLSSIVLAALLVAIWTLAAREPPDNRRFVLSCAAALVGLLAFGHVLSPQLLIWLLPIIPLIGGRLGLAALALFSVALAATHLWFSRYYVDFAERLTTGSTVLLLARDLLLVVLLAALAWPTPRVRQGSRDIP